MCVCECVRERERERENLTASATYGHWTDIGFIGLREEVGNKKKTFQELINIVLH